MNPYLNNSNINTSGNNNNEFQNNLNLTNTNDTTNFLNQMQNQQQQLSQQQQQFDFNQQSAQQLSALMSQNNAAMFNPNALQRNLLPKTLPNAMPKPNLQMPPQFMYRPPIQHVNIPKPQQIPSYLQPTKPSVGGGIGTPNLPITPTNQIAHLNPKLSHSPITTEQQISEPAFKVDLEALEEGDIIKLEDNEKAKTEFDRIKGLDKEYELKLKKQTEKNNLLKAQLQQKLTLNRTKPNYPPRLGAAPKMRIPSYLKFGLQQPRKINRLLSGLKLGLCPIRLELELNQHKLRDVLVWNVYEPIISIQAFSEVLCQDSHLPLEFSKLIEGSMMEQIEDYIKYGEETLVQLKTLSDQGKILPELIVDIVIDITIGNVNLEDKFSWDILSPHNDPELLAQLTCQDLGLGAPQRSIRSVHEVGTYTPMLTELSPFELDRMEKDREREYRRKRRQTRSRRGVALPEREPQKTAPTRHPPLPLPIPFPNSDPSALSRALSPKSQQKAAGGEGRGGNRGIRKKYNFD
ncbi:hypothetical protein CONCODRAFT_6488 [Conidiobolus coronatus NRRL 28638]|uniref:SNF5-domain-containing protein n=1 Tax=Conidiobolus coronatus (strain ATCC 28846 / CBS 209.66 / NRRL 28638) TaxID=796925 RepID=A0A137P795_CONC2|nr:hypothetical protein CONCODRAFT_6488 [Conidiobolus coronatus NRRL 28638]|eukprot:KXN70865.1 hypothetical protein CONCODRAFT_6488 [Conidiobolus coronatus NRRL 28638]